MLGIPITCRPFVSVNINGLLFKIQCKLSSNYVYVQSRPSSFALLLLCYEALCINNRGVASPYAGWLGISILICFLNKEVGGRLNKTATANELNRVSDKYDWGFK